MCKTHHFQVILLDFTIIYALDGIYVYCICVEKYYIMVCHLPFLSSSVFSDDTLAAEIDHGRSIYTQKLANAMNRT